MSLVAGDLGAADEFAPNVEALPCLVVLEDIELNKAMVDAMFAFPIFQLDELAGAVVEASDASGGDCDVVIGVE